MDKEFLDVDVKSRDFIFNLGQLFAQGKAIGVNNVGYVLKQIQDEKAKGYKKSFNMMTLYWAINNLTADFSHISPDPKRVFLICPVRNATDEEKANLQRIIEKYEGMGYLVHYPERDTNQNPFVSNTNTGGYNICLANARAIANAQTVVIYYNKSSVGSMFDVGVTYYLTKNNPNRKFIVENEFDYDETNSIDQKIMELVNLTRDNLPDDQACPNV